MTLRTGLEDGVVAQRQQATGDDAAVQAKVCKVQQKPEDGSTSLKSVSGNAKRVGAAPQARRYFSGGTGTSGAPEPEGCESNQKLRRCRTPQKPRSSAETNGQDRERDRTDHHFAGGSSRRNCAIQTIANSRARYWKSTPAVRRRSRTAWQGQWNAR